MGAGLSAAELHGLVDGLLEPERRGDVLRRLARSPADRARVEAWQEQSDIIRNAFGEIAREPLPAALNLAPLFQTEDRSAPGPSAPRVGRRAKMLAAMILATMILLGVSSFASWVTWTALPPKPQLAEAPPRGTTDATLAGRAVSALADPAPAPNTRRRSTSGLARIPDLVASGFSLAGADASATAPGTLVLHYRNARGERLVIGVTRTVGESEAAPKPIGETYGWHHRDTAFALAGTVRRERLRDIALSLQGGADGD